MQLFLTKSTPFLWYLNNSLLLRLHKATSFHHPLPWADSRQHHLHPQLLSFSQLSLNPFFPHLRQKGILMEQTRVLLLRQPLSGISLLHSFPRIRTNQVLSFSDPSMDHFWPRHSLFFHNLQSSGLQLSFRKRVRIHSFRQMRSTLRGT